MQLSGEIADGSGPVRRGWQRAALPHLEGRRGRIVGALYWLLALATSILIAGSFWFNALDFFGNMPTAAGYGFRTQTRDHAAVIGPVASAEARASGLREGNRIVAIDGQLLAADATEYMVADRLAGDRDGRIALVTRSADGTMRTHRLTRAPNALSTVEGDSRLPLWLYITITFTSIQLPLVALFAASALLARRRPRDPEAMLFAYGLLLMCVSPGAGFWLNALGGVDNSLLQMMVNFGATLTFAAIAIFPDGRFATALSRIAVALAGLVALLIVANAAQWAPVSLLDLAALSMLVAALGAVRLRYRRTPDGVERQQIKWAVFGFGAALALLVPAQIASMLDLIGEDGPLPFLIFRIVYPFALLLIPAGLLVSLLRYRLYDAEAVISRSAGYALLTLIIGATLAGSAKAIEIAIESWLGRGAGLIPGAIAAALAVVMVAPLNSRLQAWTERRFQKGLLHLRRDLPTCVDDLRETSSLDQMLDAVIDRLTQGVRAVRAAVVIGRDVERTRAVDAAEVERWLETARLDPEVEGLSCDRADRLFPMRIPLRVRHDSAGAFGWILLGPRPDASFYGRDERETLAQVADPIARAVQIVLVRSSREAEVERRSNEQQQRLAAVERQVAEAMAAIARLTGSSSPGEAPA